jgi:hypothetical protein
MSPNPSIERTFRTSGVGKPGPVNVDTYCNSVMQQLTLATKGSSTVWCAVKIGSGLPSSGTREPRSLAPFLMHS